MALDQKINLRCSAPTRVDLAGGTLDLWPIYNLLPKKATVNFGIDLRASAELSTRSDRLIKIESVDQNVKMEGDYTQIVGDPKLPLLSLIIQDLWDKTWPGFDLKITAKSPSGAGLGGSSCLAVVILNILDEARSLLMKTRREISSHEDLVSKAKNIESKIIKAPTGIQDYWGALRGGLNIITYPFGAEQVQTLALSDFMGEEFGFFAVYSGQSRASSLNNWNIFKGFFDQDKRLVSVLSQIGELSWQLSQALAQREWKEVFRLSAQEWELRTQMWPDIETAETKKVSRAALEGGARLARVCGAGGGGVLAVFFEAEHREKLRRSLIDAGCQILDAKLTDQGLHLERI